jgi:hypothetical protein
MGARRSTLRVACTAVAVAVIGVLLAGNPATALTKLRLGKAQANQFAFIPAGVGVDTALDLLANSFIDMKLLPSKPDMSILFTEAFLPK